MGSSLQVVAVEDLISCEKTSMNIIKNGKTTAIKLTRWRMETQWSWNELYKIAETKGYYSPAKPANQDEINTVKNEVE